MEIADVVTSKDLCGVMESYNDSYDILSISFSFLEKSNDMDIARQLISNFMEYYSACLDVKDYIDKFSPKITNLILDLKIGSL